MFQETGALIFAGNMGVYTVRAAYHVSRYTYLLEFNREILYLSGANTRLVGFTVQSNRLALLDSSRKAHPAEVVSRRNRIEVVKMWRVCIKRRFATSRRPNVAISICVPQSTIVDTKIPATS